MTRTQLENTAQANKIERTNEQAYEQARKSDQDKDAVPAVGLPAESPPASRTSALIPRLTVRQCFCPGVGFTLQCNN